MTTMVSQENFIKLWEETFSSKVYRCSKCQAIIDSKFNICTLCYSGVKYQSLKKEEVNEEGSQSFVPVTPIFIDFSTKDSAKPVFINFGSYIEKGLDKLGDGIIFVMGKVQVLVMYILNFFYRKP